MCNIIQQIPFRAGADMQTRGSRARAILNIILQICDPRQKIYIPFQLYNRVRKVVNVLKELTSLVSSHEVLAGLSSSDYSFNWNGSID